MTDKKPDHPRLVNLAGAKDAAEDAARAKLARDVAESLRIRAESRPMYLELITATARDWFDKFQALQKAGFTAAQALELCWRPLS
jgi:thiazole synthase ThiGH ThiG subunit